MEADLHSSISYVNRSSSIRSGKGDTRKQAWPWQPGNTAVGSGEGAAFPKKLVAHKSRNLLLGIRRERDDFRAALVLLSREMHPWRLSAFLTPKKSSGSTLTS